MTTCCFCFYKFLDGETVESLREGEPQPKQKYTLFVFIDIWCFRGSCLRVFCLICVNRPRQIAGQEVVGQGEVGGAQIRSIGLVFDQGEAIAAAVVIIVVAVIICIFEYIWCLFSNMHV